MIDEVFLDAVHRELSARLARGGAAIDRYYFCPHLADAPLERYRGLSLQETWPGMIEQACRDMNLDPARSFTIGDRALDVACGAAAGTHDLATHRSWRVEEGAAGDLSRRSGEPASAAKADVILNNLMEAAAGFLRRSPR